TTRTSAPAAARDFAQSSAASSSGSAAAATPGATRRSAGNRVASAALWTSQYPTIRPPSSATNIATPWSASQRRTSTSSASGSPLNARLIALQSDEIAAASRGAAG